MVVPLLIKIVLVVWLASLAFFLLRNLLNGDLHTQGLLRTQARDARLDPERVQLLVLTFGSVGYYALSALNGEATYVEVPTDVEGVKEKVRSLPDAPAWLLSIFAGSNAVYLGGKIIRKQTKET